MLRVRVIPALLLDDQSLVKTRRFKSARYIGDPCNTVRIFNELEVDELAFLDITATRQGRAPNFMLLEDIATECFMPVSYGGGVTRFDHAARIFSTGFEKVIVNSQAYAEPELITQIADVYGTQAVVVSIDVARGLFGGTALVSHGGRKRQSSNPVAWAKEVEARGAGEILLTSVENEGTWSGYDLALVRAVSDAVNIPVIAHGGAGAVEDLARAVDAGASAVAVGSTVVFQAKDRGVLVSFPAPADFDTYPALSGRSDVQLSPSR